MDVSFSAPTVVYSGFWWRVDEDDKVLQYEREAVGGVRRLAHNAAPLLPWAADRQSPFTVARFATEQEGIAFVEAAMRPYLQWKAFVAASVKAPQGLGAAARRPRATRQDAAPM